MVRISNENSELVRDDCGNALGGLRTPYVDVPIASHVASSPDDPEGICGSMTYFTKEQVKEIYGSTDAYLEKFAAYVDEQVKENWISAIDGQKMKEWSEAAIQKLR
jgi:hypothetical protein